MAESITTDYPKDETLAEVIVSIKELRQSHKEFMESVWDIYRLSTERSERERERREHERQQQRELEKQEREQREHERLQREQERQQQRELEKQEREQWELERQQEKELEDERHKKRIEELSGLSKEGMRESDKLTKTMEETSRYMKELGKHIGGLHNSFGELTEHLVAPGIVERFEELGFYFGSFADGAYRIFGDDKKLKTEIDLLLDNDDYIIGVEIKSKPVDRDIEHHLKRLEIMREHWNKKEDTRKILGAIAGAVFPKEVKELALKAGLYVLVQSGDTIKMEIPDGFVPQKW
jgi:uncharacterized protein YoxC